MRTILISAVALSLCAFGAASAKDNGGPYKLDAKGGCHDIKGALTVKTMCAPAPAPAMAAKPAPAAMTTKPAPAMMAGPAMKAKPAATPKAAAPPSADALAAKAKAPAGSTAICTDGTYSKNKTHAGSCSGHKGVKYFFD